jgi:hypothetical protein
MFVQAKTFDFPQAPAGTVVVGMEKVHTGSWSEKGYDYTRDPGAGFTANLEGSVAEGQWTLIAALAASGQAAIAAHYNWVRINVSVGGALGATTRLVISGKEYS